MRRVSIIHEDNMVIVDGQEWHEFKGHDGLIIFRRQRKDGSWQNVMPESVTHELEETLRRFQNNGHPSKNLPKPGKKKPCELGDAIEIALKKVGVTKEKVSIWLGRDCNCGVRHEKLNLLDRWARNTIKGMYKNAKKRLEACLKK